MVQMVAIHGMATNHVMRESFPDDSLHTGIWKTDTLKEVCIKVSGSAFIPCIIHRVGGKH